MAALIAPTSYDFFFCGDGGATACFAGLAAAAFTAFVGRPSSKARVLKSCGSHAALGVLRSLFGDSVKSNTSSSLSESEEDPAAGAAAVAIAASLETPPPAEVISAGATPRLLYIL